MPVARTGRPSRARWLLTACFAAICAVHTVRSSGVLWEVTYLVVTVGAGIVGVIGVVRRPPRLRFAWGCIVSGVMLSGIGDVLFSILTHVSGAPPDLSAADAFYLCSYVALGTGLLALLVERDSDQRIDVDGLIDMGSFAILSVIVVSQIGDVGDIFGDTTSGLGARLVWSAYPILDATLLAVLVRALVSRRLRDAAGVWMSIGVGGWLASDFATLLIADPTVVSVWLDVGWMGGSAALAVSAWQGGRTEKAPAVTVLPVTGAQVLIGLLPLLLPGAIETVVYLRGYDTNPIPMFFASGALILLAYARARRLVSLRDRQEARLEANQRYYHALADNSADAVVVLDGNDLIINETPHLAAMVGRPMVSTVGRDFLDIVVPVDLDQGHAALDRMRATSDVMQMELNVRHGDGSERWIATRSVNLTDDPAIGGLVVNLHDITDRKRAEEELTHRAFHDSLTGLANRALFRDRVEHALERTARTGTDIAVVYLDLDGFKTINDSRGHEAGDDFLREVATRLQSAVRTADTVARLGGDEFAILIEQSTRPLDEASTVADRILQSLSTPIHVDDQQITLSASIGITLSDPQSTASTMLRNADIAMYRAKTSGKSKWTVYDPDMRTAAVERLQLQNDLSTALTNNEFRLVYQSVIELETEEVVGFEALLRWQHPTRGTVEPDAFISLLEENNAIVAIGHWVLVEACMTAAAWQKLRPDRRLTMAVNLSTRQIATPDIIDHVRDALARSGFPPEQLILELTETVLVEDATTAVQRLEELHKLNVRLAIDDFGTGYSSLSYLRQFPIDILKIDRSFVNSITDRHQIPAIVRGLLDLSKTLQLETVAEGIERGVQRDTLRDQDCKYGQGFLFAEPLSPEEVRELLTRIPTTELA